MRRYFAFSALAIETFVMQELNRRVPRVLDVGNCVPDHGQISALLKQHFDAETDVAHTLEQALERLASDNFDLVLVNRKLDHDYSDGIEVIKRMKQDPLLAQVPVMLVTNYAEHQAAAVAVGALLGFGKLELASPATHARLQAVLAPTATETRQPPCR
jgi:CheY-like chemotaxis protein